MSAYLETLGIKSVLAKVSELLFFQDSLYKFNNENQFLVDKNIIIENYKKIDYIYKHILNGFDLSFKIDSIFDKLKIIKDVEINLESEDIANFFVLCNSAMEVTDLYKDKIDYVEDINLDFLDFSFIKPVVNSLQKYLLPSGVLKTDLIELVNVERKIVESRKKLLEAANSFIKNQTEIYTFKNEIVRDGRVVLPLKANCKSEIKGIIHQTSDSKNTLFVEPFELVPFNNSLIEAQNEKLIIIKKILKIISKIIYENKDIFFKLFKKFIAFDIIHAKAKFIYENKLTIPQIGNKLILNKAYHPYLKSPVPLDIRIYEETNIVVISGPNAGGKTVLLKTLGINSYCFQSGLGAFCSENSVLPIFDKILVDIGDSQSIENQLSTYSAHLVNIKNIFKIATKKSLILLDEFASGTDFLEGGAISIAILNKLQRICSTVALTTHNSLIKEYGLTSKNFLLFSMEFDTKKFSPTYRIIENEIGESHAIDIATSIKFDKEVIDEAKNFLKNEIPETTKIIKELNDKKLNLKIEEENLKSRIKNIEKLEEQFKVRDLKIKEAEYQLKQEQKSLNTSFIREQKKELLDFIKKASKDSLNIEKAKKYLKDLNDENSNLSNDFIKAENEYISRKNITLKENMKVEVGEYKRDGYLLKKSSNNKWLVQVGSIKMEISEADIYIPKETKSKSSEVSVYHSKPTNFAYELDVRGQTLNEALENLEKYLDDAILLNLYTVSVIHGTGTGVLQKGVHDYLRNLPFIESYSFAMPEHGGFGKTYIKFKS